MLCYSNGPILSFLFQIKFFAFAKMENSEDDFINSLLSAESSSQETLSATQSLLNEIDQNDENLPEISSFPDDHLPPYPDANQNSHDMISMAAQSSGITAPPNVVYDFQSAPSSGPDQENVGSANKYHHQMFQNAAPVSGMSSNMPTSAAGVQGSRKRTHGVAFSDSLNQEVIGITRRSEVSVRVFRCVSVCVCACLLVCVSLCACLCMSLCLFACVSLCGCLCLSTCLSICVYLFACLLINCFCLVMFLISLFWLSCLGTIKSLE